MLCKVYFKKMFPTAHIYSPNLKQYASEKELDHKEEFLCNQRKKKSPK